MRILAVDYGSVRVGLALSDPTGTIATPLDTLAITSLRDAARKIVKRAEAEGAEVIVVGLPINLQGEEGPAAENVHKLIEQIRRRTQLPIHTVDERLTSRFAEAAMAEDGLSSRQRRGKADPIAASLILRAYLDQSNK